MRCEIIIVTENKPDRSFTLHIFTENGQRQKFVKVRPENDVFIEDIFYDKVSKNIISYALSSDLKKVLIEYWSGETGELQFSYSLLLTTVPRDVQEFCLICGRNGALALLGPQRVAFLKNSL